MILYCEHSKCEMQKEGLCIKAMQIEMLGIGDIKIGKDGQCESAQYERKALIINTVEEEMEKQLKRGRGLE